MTDDAGPLGGLIRLLDLERLEENLFRGRSPSTSVQRVFGGQVAGQALVAAGRTAPPDRAVHSLHAYFIHPGHPNIPILYQVDRTRDGRSFTTRRVAAVQHGRSIFVLTASFAVPADGIHHQEPMPEVPMPDQLPTLAERLSEEGDIGIWRTLPRPIELRYVDDPPRVAARSAQPREPHSQVWLRANGTLPDDPLLHVCVLTYGSDMTLLDSVVLPHGLHHDSVFLASLDHAMWFHAPFRADEWLLYDQHSPWAGNSRGLAVGRIFDVRGRLVCSVVQEGLIRALR